MLDKGRSGEIGLGWFGLKWVKLGLIRLVWIR